MEPDDPCPLDPLEGGDTEPNAIFPEVIDTEAERTGATRCCTECGGPVAAYVGSPPPRLEDFVLALYWKECTVSGKADKPVWWFCPVERWFGIRDVQRVRIEKPAELT